jgi:hypothetical protein
MPSLSALRERFKHNNQHSIHGSSSSGSPSDLCQGEMARICRESKRALTANTLPNQFLREGCTVVVNSNVFLSNAFFELAEAIVNSSLFARSGDTQAGITFGLRYLRLCRDRLSYRSGPHREVQNMGAPAAQNCPAIDRQSQSCVEHNSHKRFGGFCLDGESLVQAA